MNRIIRQAFGTTRPKEVFLNLLTFDRMVTKPIVHIVYWVGLGLFVIAACGVAGVAIGNGLHEGELMAWALSFVMMVTGWLMIFIGVLLWRSFCEFYLAVLSIAEDLRFLRQFQEKLPENRAPMMPPAPAHVDVAVAPQPMATTAAPVPPADGGDILDTPFFQPRFGQKRD